MSRPNTPTKSVTAVRSFDGGTAIALVILFVGVLLAAFSICPVPPSPRVDRSISSTEIPATAPTATPVRRVSAPERDDDRARGRA